MTKFPQGSDTPVTKTLRFILHSPMYAMLSAILVNGVLIRFAQDLGCIALVISALVTLCYGARDGLLVTLAAILPGIVIAVGLQAPWFVFASMLYTALMSFGLAFILRIGGSWRLLFQVASLLATTAVLAVHYFVPDIAHLWATLLADYANLLKSSTQGLNTEAMMHGLKSLAPVFTGMQVAVATLIAMASVFFARWAQAKLYKPGGLAEEMQHLRSDWMSMTLLGMVLVGIGLELPLANDILPAIVLPQVAMGCVITHQMLNEFRFKRWILFGFYAGLTQLFVPIAAALIFFLLVDLIFDFRGHKDGSYLTRKNS